MTPLASLWLPILLAAFRKLPDEDRARDSLRALAIPPGDYMTPCPSSAQELKSPPEK